MGITGRRSEKEMSEEHPLELAQLPAAEAAAAVAAKAKAEANGALPPA